MEPLRLVFVEGATPQKWIRIWRERMRAPIEFELVDEATQQDSIRAGTADLGLVRLPIDRTGMHCIPLYEETAVVALPRDHPGAEFDALTLTDLAGESTIDTTNLSWEDVIEVVASGAGIASMPQSIARLHHRRDVVAVPLTDVPPTTIGLAWLEEHQSENIDAFIGIVRGRTANSSRG